MKNSNLTSCNKYNRKSKSLKAVILGSTLFLTASMVQADVCSDIKTEYDSTPEVVFFSYDRVLACYRSVDHDPSDVQNVVDVINFWFEESPLRNIYDRDFGWRAAVNALNRKPNKYKSDFDFQQAVESAVRINRNIHYNYREPVCYNSFRAIMPLELGSMVIEDDDSSDSGSSDSLEQIVYVEFVYAVDSYQALTGIDVTDLKGKKIVRMNGKTPIEYFRRWGNNYGRYSPNDGTSFDNVVNTDNWNYTTTNFPQESKIKFVFEDIHGKRQKLTLPWSFDLIAPSRVEDKNIFAENCFEANPLKEAVDEFNQMSFNSVFTNDAMLATKILNNPHNFRESKKFETGDGDDSSSDSSHGGETEHLDSSGYVEVPDDQRNILIEELTPTLSQWQGLSYNNDEATVVAINRIGESIENRKQVLRDTTAYACDNSEKLIIDLRSSSGGSTVFVNWISNYLFPEMNGFGPGIHAKHLLNTSQRVIDNFVGWPSFDELFGDPLNTCPYSFSTSPGCYVNPFTGQTYQDLSWITDTQFINLAGVIEPLTKAQLIGRNALSGDQFESIQCPGKFKGENLIFITNGISNSSAPVLAYLMDSRATTVVTGGILNEKSTFGRSLNGNDVNAFDIVNEQLSTYDYWDDFPVFDPTSLTPPAGVAVGPIFSRNVNIGFEGTIALTNDLQGYIANDYPLGPRPDLQVRTWQSGTNTSTRGFVYRIVLEAVEKYYKKKHKKKYKKNHRNKYKKNHRNKHKDDDSSSSSSS